MARLTIKKVVKLIKRKEKGLSSRLIARQLRISKRRINQVWREYNTTGSVKLNKPGKKPTRILTRQEKDAILHLHTIHNVGARIIAKLLRKRYAVRIGNTLVHDALLKHTMAVPNIHKQGRRKPWIRYERKHSLSAGHMDWHTAKWCENTQVGTVIDDSSRKILAATEGEHATGEQTIHLVQTVLDQYGHIRRVREIITDHGTQFFCNTPSKEGLLGVNEFQRFLEKQGIKHIRSGVHKPTTIGKLSAIQQTIFRELPNWNNDLELWRYQYNHERPHQSLHLLTPAKVYFQFKRHKKHYTL